MSGYVINNAHELSVCVSGIHISNKVDALNRLLAIEKVSSDPAMLPGLDGDAFDQLYELIDSGSDAAIVSFALLIFKGFSDISAELKAKLLERGVFDQLAVLKAGESRLLQESLSQFITILLINRPHQLMPLPDKLFLAPKALLMAADTLKVTGLSTLLMIATCGYTAIEPMLNTDLHSKLMDLIYTEDSEIAGLSLLLLGLMLSQSKGLLAASPLSAFNQHINSYLNKYPTDDFRLSAIADTFVAIADQSPTYFDKINPAIIKFFIDYAQTVSGEHQQKVVYMLFTLADKNEACKAAIRSQLTDTEMTSLCDVLRGMEGVEKLAFVYRSEPVPLTAEQKDALVLKLTATAAAPTPFAAAVSDGDESKMSEAHI